MKHIETCPRCGVTNISKVKYKKCPECGAPYLPETERLILDEHEGT